MINTRGRDFETMYRWLRPLLFRFDPETAHRIGLTALRMGSALGPLNPLRQGIKDDERVVMGLRFPNPVGLAAGMDKNGDCIEGLAALGFGFLELGTVTPRPQAGNPRPRLFRLPEAEALINRMGFNSRGVDHLVARVRAARFRGVLGINIGKNLTTPVENALDDYLECLRKVYPYAGYAAVNISSPNTPGLRDLQRGIHLERLLQGLRSEQKRLAELHGRYVPLAVKIAPELELDELRDFAAAVSRHGIDGVIATNTTSDRPDVVSLPHAEENGGLSGRPLFAKSTEVLKQLTGLLPPEVPVIASGGILSGQDARRKIEAGARLVQIYTGFIYRGPALIPEIAESLR